MPSHAYDAVTSALRASTNARAIGTCMRAGSRESVASQRASRPRTASPPFPSGGSCASASSGSRFGRPSAAQSAAAAPRSAETTCTSVLASRERDRKSVV